MVSTESLHPNWKHQLKKKMEVVEERRVLCIKFKTPLKFYLLCKVFTQLFYEWSRHFLHPST